MSDMVRRESDPERITITFQPERDVLSLLNKAKTKIAGRGRKPHGLQSRLINEALRAHFGELVGKREAA